MTPTASDLCPDCGHPGYDGHDMRTAGYPCLDCACGHEDDRHDRLDRWIEATLGARLHMFAVPRRSNPGDLHWMIRSYDRWRQLYHREAQS